MTFERSHRWLAEENAARIDGARSRQVANLRAYYLDSGDVVTLTAFAADWTSSSDTADLTLEAFDAEGAPVGSAGSSTGLAAEDVKWWEQSSSAPPPDGADRPR